MRQLPLLLQCCCASATSLWFLHASATVAVVVVVVAAIVAIVAVIAVIAVIAIVAVIAVIAVFFSVPPCLLTSRPTSDIKAV